MALRSLTFNNTGDRTISVGFWIIQKFTRDINVETVKIWDNPIQIADNNSRIIDTAQLRFHTSTLLSSTKVYVRFFCQLRSRKGPIVYSNFVKFSKVEYNYFVISLLEIIKFIKHHGMIRCYNLLIGLYLLYVGYSCSSLILLNLFNRFENILFKRDVTLFRETMSMSSSVISIIDCWK